MQVSKTEAIQNFLNLYAHPDLASLFSPSMEVQVNVKHTDDGPVAGGYRFRIPKDAKTEPICNDGPMTYDLSQAAEAIGLTGWSWEHRVSKWVGFDFDAISNHAAGISADDLVEVRERASGLPYVTVRRSTSGHGLHLYVFLPDVPTATHTGHARLAGAVLAKMSADCGFDFESKIDCLGGILWVWSDRMGTTGFDLLKQGEVLADVPSIDAPVPAPAPRDDLFDAMTRGSVDPLKVASALKALDPNMQRKDWVRVAAALKAGLGEAGCELFTEWSKGGRTYKPGEPERTFESLRADGKVGLGTLFHMAKEAGWSDRPSRPLTDLGNAERFVDQYGDQFKWCQTWKRWLVWDGARWADDDTLRAQAVAVKVVRSIYDEAKAEADSDRSKAIAKFAMASEKAERVAGLLKLVPTLEGMTVTPDQLDQNNWLFNCQNGTLDLEAGTLRPHDPKDLITKLCPVPFDPSAKCPLWDATLELFLPDKDLIAYWQRICGYAMVGVIREHLFPIAYGTGSNGKSTVLGTTLDVYGPDYAMKVDDSLIMSRDKASLTERAPLFGKRLIVAIETGSNCRLGEKQVKALTGGDKVTARRLYGEQFDFKPTWTLILATNHKPIIVDQDKGIWRRIQLVPFQVSLDGSQADLEMPEKLKAEYPGILAWCVRGCRDWLANGIGDHASVVQETNEYKGDQDVLGAFLEECTTEGDRVKASVLFDRYRLWADSGKERVMTQTAFGRAIVERGVSKVKKMDGTFYQGLELRTI